MFKRVKWYSHLIVKVLGYFWIDENSEVQLEKENAENFN